MHICTYEHIVMVRNTTITLKRQKEKTKEQKKERKKERQTERRKKPHTHNITLTYTRKQMKQLVNI